MDEKYHLQEIILTFSYIRYSYIANNIQDSIEEILNNWNLRSKIHSIITDNGSNIKKYVKNMEGIIEWHSYVSHTLQLVIEKGLILDYWLKN